MERKNAWEKYPEGKKRDEVFKFAEEYRQFISNCKTERECTSFLYEKALKEDFLDLNDVINSKRYQTMLNGFKNNKKCEKYAKTY